MYRITVMIGCLLVVACTTNKHDPELDLSETAPKTRLIHKSESMLRGVRGNSDTIPRGRPAAILDVSYELECEDGATLQERFQRAGKMLDERFIVAYDLYYNNPRENGYWRRNGTRLILETTRCRVALLDFTKKSEDPIEVLQWLISKRRAEADANKKTQ